ncbi:unnamed protein product [Rotaria sp. Silwood1]|nr:unnamed protein product [Rotaria sp. Silwood1]
MGSSPSNTANTTEEKVVSNGVNHTAPIATKGLAVDSASSPFKVFDFERRVPKADDVFIRIHYCGICHSDIHQVKNEWHTSKYPMVPGHEITGVVEQVGSNVRKFRIGDHVGVGCMVDSCLQCNSCKKNFEQHCPDTAFTYSSTELDKVTPTYGGYSNFITVKEHFVCKVPKNLPLDAAAPLLCAGITTYSPLRQHNVGKNTRMGVIGLGGLGHMAVKFGVAMGAHVTVISTSESKRDDATKLGAKAFLVSKDAEQLKGAENSFDFIIDTVSAQHDVAAMINLLAFQGVYCMVGAPPKPAEIPSFVLLFKRPIITGSLIGGMKETQEMLDFCGKHEITCEIEKIEAIPEQINVAYDRTLKSDVREYFICKVPKNLPLDAAAPLLCAGITTYSPLRQHNVGKNTYMGVIGLGHMAVKFGVAMGAHVTVISTSESKRDDATKLGAKAFLVSKDAEQLKEAENSFDFIIDTVSAQHDVAAMINLLAFQGVYCMVGAPPKPAEIPSFVLLFKRPIITGSLIGSMKETQEMLDFCGKHEITCEIERTSDKRKKST